ncbi:hypothetical protein JCM17961_19970 [Endothiovibrio diazotrophicus]
MRREDRAADDADPCCRQATELAGLAWGFALAALLLALAAALAHALLLPGSGEAHPFVAIAGTLLFGLLLLLDLVSALIAMVTSLLALRRVRGRKAPAALVVSLVVLLYWMIGGQ